MSKNKVQVHPDHWKERGREPAGKTIVPEVERAKLKQETPPPPRPGKDASARGKRGKTAR